MTLGTRQYNVQAVGRNGVLRGRPRGLLKARSRPRTKISPPHTPVGSARSRAPARHDWRLRHSRQYALARLSSAGTLENHSAGSSCWQGVALVTGDIVLTPLASVTKLSFAVGESWPSLLSGDVGRGMPSASPLKDIVSSRHTVISSVG